MGLFKFRSKQQREFETDIKEIRRREGMQPIKVKGTIVGYEPKLQKQRVISKKKSRSEARRLGTQVGKSVGEFGRSGRKPIDMTFEQDAMQQLMGGGSRGSIWGANDAVHINHDLNPRMRGDTGTAEVFGLNKPQSFQGGDPETRSMFGL